MNRHLRAGREGWSTRWLVTVVLIGAMVVAASRARVVVDGDVHSAASLRNVAVAFNRDYAANDVGPVYDRFDEASRMIISRAAYVRRHRVCPTAPAAARVGAVTPDGAWWVVRYEIDGVVLRDYWRYELGRWTFDLARSNPQAVALYRLPFNAYARAVGCALGS